MEGERYHKTEPSAVYITALPSSCSMPNAPLAMEQKRPGVVTTSPPRAQTVTGGSWDWEVTEDVKRAKAETIERNENDFNISIMAMGAEGSGQGNVLE